MSFSSINIQGNIISSEILDKIRAEEKFKHQSPEAFGLSKTASLRDEIGMAWSIMRAHWQAYKVRLENLPKGDTGTSLTREKLIIPLLAELGYEVSIQKAQQINGKSYAISHGATNRDMYPIHIMGYNDLLDKRRENSGPRLSPHALVQEYLNNTEHLFALVTNGRQLRLLRDATRLVRMSYLEFDLERMFEEELYADFSLLYRTLHVTRMPETMESGAEAVIEHYHLESLASGTRIREKLSEAVENSIKTLANGFLSHKNNTDLIGLIENNRLDADTFYTYQLRLIYRILFLIVLEERKLIFPDDLPEEQQRFRDIYYRYYSIERLRKLTENRVYVDADKYDLWESLKTTFLLFEDENYGSKIGIKPLGSGLFASNALGNLKEQFFSNGNLIDVLKRLTTFVSDQGQLVRVNYSDLDVEEFGSVYEGLLEYDPKVEKIGAQYVFSFVLGDGRSSSGSHYTPEELVKPLIKHSLDYIIADKLKEEDPEAALLSITVCDVACGSGHILLSAARKIAAELASFRDGAEQPSPTYYRAAIRDVIRNCIYGVDLNPLAVELCKVALWLEAHNPNEPLNFLDHHIKCGNAIVGLAHFKELKNGIATEAFKTLPGDEKEVAATLRKRNTEEQKRVGQLSTYDTSLINDNLEGILKEFNNWEQLPEITPEEIKIKDAAYTKLTSGKKWFRIKQLADIQIAQFFIPKTLENREKLITDNQYRTYLSTPTQIVDRGPALAAVVAQEKRFFHWFLEFPKVFQNGGFDCVLGNPPFKGGAKISGEYGNDFLNYLKINFIGLGGQADLVSYFFRRNFNIIKLKGFISLISTNTIAQGDAREGSLVKIVEEGGSINHAIKSMKWPGLAAVEISIVSIYNGKWLGNLFLDTKNVERINTYLDSHINFGDPTSLNKNKNKCFKGSSLIGDGFILSKSDAEKYLSNHKSYKEVLFPFINGQKLNNDYKLKPENYVVDFFERNEKEAANYKELFEILKEKVKPYRQRWKKDKKGNEIIGKYALSKTLRENWWRFERIRPELYRSLRDEEKVLAHTIVTKTHAFSFVNTNQVFSSSILIFKYSDFVSFSCLQSSFNEYWAWRYSSTMKTDRSYNISEGFETYPFPEEDNGSNIFLEEIGNRLYTFRSSVMQKLEIGLTKLYNQIHNENLVIEVDSELSGKNFSKKYSKETWNLHNQLEVKKLGNISYEEAVPLIFELRNLHKQLDEVVLAAYNWPDIDLNHDFHQVDYLPENDNIRYTIHPEARKEILKRLLLLNHERYEEEARQGLHKKKDVEAYFKQKGKEVPEEIAVHFAKHKGKTSKKKTSNKSNKVEEPSANYKINF